MKIVILIRNSECTDLQQLQYASACLFLLLQPFLHLCELFRCYSYSVHASCTGI